ncbi:MAG: helix-turn-helix transcriptional regulator [Saprospiraceae bacterium]|nr:helix-turn-helix transcriptional regulator [Saprospiraceae bacterium]
MKTLTRHVARLLSLWVLVANPFFVQSQIVDGPQSLREQARQLRFSNPEAARRFLVESLEQALQEGDTTQIIEVLLGTAEMHGHLGQYQESYDHLWKAMMMADPDKIEHQHVEVLISLGRYYSFYKRKEKAIEYLHRALQNRKMQLANGLVDSTALLRNFYALCSTYRELDLPEQAAHYIDSCRIYQGGQTPFLKFEQAFVDYKKGHVRVAMDSLRSIQSWFAENNPGFQVLLNTLMGDVAKDLYGGAQSLVHYEKAAQNSEYYNSHLDFAPIIYQKLANEYQALGDFERGYQNLHKAKELDRRFFDSRSSNNVSLLEIKDEFQLSQDRERDLRREQRMAELEYEDRVAFLHNVLLIGGMVAMALLALLYFNYVRNKHRTEKDLLRKKKELEVNKANELVELKNRELAASSLKLIEKDEILADVKERMLQQKGDLKETEVKKLVRSINHNQAQNWEEFEQRFIAVNKNFYANLNAQFPKLTRGDQKICALVKLNLSSKEMAKLLGISIESVHTNRYRLRKKLKLNRDVSLTEFVAKL